jgi:hypothetical protein
MQTFTYGALVAFSAETGGPILGWTWTGGVSTNYLGQTAYAGYIPLLGLSAPGSPDDLAPPNDGVLNLRGINLDDATAAQFRAWIEFGIRPPGQP